MAKSKAEELAQVCDQFLSAYDATSLPRVALRGMTPVLDKLMEVFQEHDLQGAELHAYPVASSPQVKPVSMQHVFINNEKQFITMLTSLPLVTEEGQVFAWARPPAPRSMEDLVELGVTPIQVVEGIKNFSQAIQVNDAVSSGNMPPALA